MGKRRRVGLSVIGVAAVLALALAVGAFAGSKRSAATTITIWSHQGQPGEVAAVQDAVTAFNASQSGIVAKLQLIPEADYTKTLQATAASGLPDVLEYDGPLMSGFAYGKKLQPVAGLVSAATITNQTASVKAQNTYFNGKLYGVSMFDSGLALYANKGLLKAAGVKWPETWKKA